MEARNLYRIAKIFLATLAMVFALDAPAFAQAAPGRTLVQAPKGGPTEAQVKQVVTGMFMAVYKESYMKAEEMKIAFSDMRFAPPTKKNLFGGYYERPIDVWPVRMDVTITWARGADIRTWKRGTQNRESFSFFKNEFGDWDFRTSGL